LIAAAWATADTPYASFTIDLNVNDTNTHLVTLYCVDWPGTGDLHQVMEIIDPNTSTALDTRNLRLPINGVYFVWRLKDHAVIRITQPDATPSQRALVSAIFFD
jgi:hypothetical protein